jgi:hypothetical protein
VDELSYRSGFDADFSHAPLPEDSAAVRVVSAAASIASLVIVGLLLGTYYLNSRTGMNSSAASGFHGASYTAGRADDHIDLRMLLVFMALSNMFRSIHSVR